MSDVHCATACFFAFLLNLVFGSNALLGLVALLLGLFFAVAEWDRRW